MKITCPKNKKHNKFVTTAHEMHDWVIDDRGAFIEDLGLVQVTHGPTIGNIFTCKKCGSEVKVEKN